MKIAMILLSALAGLAYLKWMLSPPPDAVGSYIPDFDDPYRRRKMIRDEEEQEMREY